MTTPCEEIASRIGELFICSTVNDFVRIQTPYFYPDGDIIDLFFKEKGGLLTLTDLGETFRWLRTQSISRSRTPKQNKIIADICLTHGVVLSHGMFNIQLSKKSDLVQAVTDLAQAIIRVSDLWFSLKNSIRTSILDEVEEFIKQKQIPYERNEKLMGQSRTFWKPHFHTRYQDRNALVYVLSTDNPGTALGIANRVVTAWYDLSYLKTPESSMKFISLFDDSTVWKAEAFRLLEGLSEISYWSRKEEFAAKLTT